MRALPPAESFGASKCMNRRRFIGPTPVCEIDDELEKMRTRSEGAVARSGFTCHLGGAAVAASQPAFDVALEVDRRLLACEVKVLLALGPECR